MILGIRFDPATHRADGQIVIINEFTIIREIVVQDLAVKLIAIADGEEHRVEFPKRPDVIRGPFHSHFHGSYASE